MFSNNLYNNYQRKNHTKHDSVNITNSLKINNHIF